MLSFALALITLFLLFAGGNLVTCTLALAGAIGLVSIDGWSSLAAIGQICWSGVGNWILTSLPLFILMGEILLHSQIGRDLFNFVSLCLGRVPAGLAVASVGACAIFAAMSGSSPATAATIGMVAIPEMEKRNYDRKLNFGTLAAGGTLGILIPPSITMILYGAIAEQSVGKLFLAGIIPGILLTLIFMIYIIARYRKAPFALQPKDALAWNQKMSIILRVIPPLLVITFVLGSIYLGICTPTEAAGVGVASSAIAAVSMRRLNKNSIMKIFSGTIRTTCMILFIIMGALIFGYFLTLIRVSQITLEAVKNLSVSPYVILFAIYLIIIALGCLIDGASITYITVPITLPIITELGFDPIWFGVILTILIEIGLITPPVGLNLYVIKGLSIKYSMADIIKGAAPFVLLMILGVLILTFFPSIALFLPNTMK